MTRIIIEYGMCSSAWLSKMYFSVFGPFGPFVDSGGKAGPPEAQAESKVK